MSKKEVKQLHKEFNNAYYGPAWHGDHTKRVLERLTENDSQKRVGESHTIMELILHIINWRHYVINCILCKPAWEQSQLENFTAGIDNPTLEVALKELESTQDQLTRMIQTLTDETLKDLVDTHWFTYKEIIHGLINHDLYHLGQINMIRLYGKG